MINGFQNDKEYKYSGSNGGKIAEFDLGLSFILGSAPNLVPAPNLSIIPETCRPCIYRECKRSTSLSICVSSIDPSSSFLF